MATTKKRPYVKIKVYAEILSMLCTWKSMWAYNVETEVKEGKLCEAYPFAWLQESKV